MRAPARLWRCPPTQDDATGMRDDTRDRSWTGEERSEQEDQRRPGCGAELLEACAEPGPGQAWKELGPEGRWKRKGKSRRRRLCGGTSPQGRGSRARSRANAQGSATTGGPLCRASGDLRKMHPPPASSQGARGGLGAPGLLPGLASAVRLGAQPDPPAGSCSSSPPLRPRPRRCGPSPPRPGSLAPQGSLERRPHGDPRLRTPQPPGPRLPGKRTSSWPPHVCCLQPLPPALRPTAITSGARAQLRATAPPGGPEGRRPSPWPRPEAWLPAPGSAPEAWLSAHPPRFWWVLLRLGWIRPAAVTNHLGNL